MNKPNEAVPGDSLRDGLYGAINPQMIAAATIQSKRQTDPVHEIEDGLEALANRARERGMNMATFIGTLEMFKQYAIQRAFTDPEDN